MPTAGPTTTAERLLREGRALRALARSLLADPTQDDDVVQDAYLAAVQHGVHGEHTGRWLGSVTRRLALLRGRRDRRRRHREELAARAETTASAADVAATAEVTRAVAEAVQQLDEPFRTAVVLRFWHRLPPREIASRTGVPTNTVRSRIQRGLARLRQRLDTDRGGRAAWAVPLGGIARRGWLGGAGTVSIGGLLMGTYGKITLAAVAVALAWTLWPDAEDVPVPRSGATVENTAAASTSAATDPSTDQGTIVRTDLADDTPRLVVTGTLVDEETMAPLAGGTVHLLSGLRTDARPLATDSNARSAHDGGFRVEESRPDVAKHPQLSIEAPDRATFRHRVPLSDRGANPVVVDVGRVLVPPGTHLRGKVVDTAGAAVANATVFVSTRSPYYAGHLHAAEVLPFLLEIARTDTTGWFVARARVAPVGPESFLVAVSERGVGYLSVDVTRHRTDLEVTVPLRPSIHLDVTVLDSGDTPVGGANVRATPRFLPLGHMADGSVQLGHRDEVLALFETTTDTDGRASLPFLPTGEGRDWGPQGAYELIVVADGFRTLHQRIVFDDEHESHSLQLASDTPVRLDVRVLDAERRPITGATVTAAGATATTDVEGACTLANIRTAGTTTHVRVAADGYLPAAESRPTPEGSRGAYEFVLQPATTLEGIVVDQDGAPVVGARVFVDAPLRAKTGADGTFHIDAVPTGELRITIIPPESQDAWAPAYPKQVRAADAPRRWVLERLAPGLTTLHVAVVDMVTGAPADPGSSALHAIDGRALMSGPFLEPVESRIGQLRYERLRPGRYKLIVAGRVERIVEVTPTDVDLRLRIEVGAPGVVHGEVSFEDVPPELVPATVTVMFGPSSRLARWVEPAAGRLLTREPGPHVWGAELKPGVDARFRLEDADPHQPLELSASGPGLIGRTTVRVPPGGETHATIRVGVAGSARLRFVPRCPVPSIRIRFRPEHGEWDPPRELHGLEGSTVSSGQLPLRTGRYHWEVTWGSGERAVEGDVVIEPRQRAEIVVDFAARKD